MQVLPTVAVRIRTAHLCGMHAAPGASDYSSIMRTTEQFP